VSLNITDCKLDELLFICDKYLSPYLTYVKDNKEVFYTAVLHNKTLGLENVYKRMFENIFNPILDRFNYPENDRRYVMMYYLKGINAIVIEWLNDGCGKSIKEISEIIRTCIYGREDRNKFLS
jgi:hypothetical protein